MAATYINGNAFQVNFILWQRDISSYFRHSYFYPSLRLLLQPRTNHFFHSLFFAFAVTLAVSIVSLLLQLQNQYLLFAYFPVLVGVSIWNHYRKTLSAAAPIVGKHYICELQTGYLRIRESEGTIETIVTPSEITQIVEKEDMVIIYTKEDTFFIPTRVLTTGQIESLLAFYQ